MRMKDVYKGGMPEERQLTGKQADLRLHWTRVLSRLPSDVNFTPQQIGNLKMLSAGIHKEIIGAEDVYPDILDPVTVGHQPVVIRVEREFTKEQEAKLTSFRNKRDATSPDDRADTGELVTVPVPRQEPKTAADNITAKYGRPIELSDTEEETNNRTVKASEALEIYASLGWHVEFRKMEEEKRNNRKGT